MEKCNCWKCSRGIKPCEFPMPPPLALPDIRQHSNHSCGEAALQVVLRYFELKVRKPVTACPVSGVHPMSLPAAFRRLGFQHVAGSMTVDDLRHHTSQGRPIITLVQMGGVGHYVVVSGVNRGKVYFVCPTLGLQKQPIQEFENRWFDHDDAGNDYRNWGIAAWL